MAFDFPPLDCHAHIDPTVTGAQVATLRGAQVFAMTRTVSEGVVALGNPQAGIYWGVGAHPALPQHDWSTAQFEECAQKTFLIGEVGLDRARALGPQLEILKQTLERSSNHLISVHSNGRINQILDSVENAGCSGVILHWFMGDRQQIARAAALGCYFSINAAMPDEQFRLLPYERVLPETDFPAARKKTLASKPGDIRELERRVVDLTRTTQDEVRRHWYRVLGSALRSSGARDTASAGLLRLVDVAAR
ncbi:TatD family hydrolase [soil metagenome]